MLDITTQTRNVFTYSLEMVSRLAAFEALKTAYIKAGLEGIYHVAKPFHRLRNSWRTNQGDLGTDMAIMIQEGGWKDVSMFMRYMNRRKSMRERIAREYNDYMKKGAASIVDLKKKQA